MSNILENLNISNILNVPQTLQYHNEEISKEPQSLVGIIVPVKRYRTDCEKNQILQEIYKKNPVLLYTLFSLQNANLLGFTKKSEVAEFFNCLIYYIELYEKKVLVSMKTAKSFKEIDHFNRDKLHTLCENFKYDEKDNDKNDKKEDFFIQQFYKKHNSSLSDVLAIYKRIVSPMARADFFASVILKNGIYMGHVYHWKSTSIPNTISMVGIRQSIESILLNECRKTSMGALKMMLSMGYFLASHYNAEYFHVHQPLEHVKKILPRYGFVNTDYYGQFSIIKTTDLKQNIQNIQDKFKIDTSLFSFLKSQMNFKVDFTNEFENIKENLKHIINKEEEKMIIQ